MYFYPGFEIEYTWHSMDECEGVMKLPKTRCLNCAKELDSSFRPDGAEPREGDVTICYGCGELMEFDGELKLVHLKPETVTKINFSELQDMHKAVQWAKEMMEKDQGEGK